MRSSITRRSTGRPLRGAFGASGQALIEYALIIALIALVALVALGTTGDGWPWTWLS